jgi:hypothetical protein
VAALTGGYTNTYLSCLQIKLSTTPFIRDMTVRMTSFSEALGEPEQDANSALTELDKGTFIYFFSFIMSHLS